MFKLLFFLMLPFCMCQNDDPRFLELLSMRSESPDGIITLNDETFESLVLGSSSRPYELYVLFEDPTSSKSSLYRSEFSTVAYSFLKNQPEFPNLLMLAVIDMSTSQTNSQKLDISSAPCIVYFPKDSTSARILQLGNPQKLALAIEAETGIQVGPISSPPKLTRFQLVILFCLFVIASPSLYRAVWPPLQDPKMWCAASIVTYLFVISGGIFTILYQVPMLTTSQGRWISQEQNFQTGVEGLLIGILYALPGLTLAFYTHVLPRQKITRWHGSGFVVCPAAICCLAMALVFGLNAWKTG